MSSDICGNCGRFKMNPGDSLFNCTRAKQAGLTYGMQVRPDTRACDAFVHVNIPVNIEVPLQSTQATPMTEDTYLDESSEPVGLCTMGQKSLVASVSVAIILVSWLLFTCARL